MENRPKKQHYIPQFLLKNFRVPGEGSLWVFDKRTSKKYKSAIRDVASERYYNDAQIAKGLYASFESRFAKIEQDAAPAFSKLVETEKILALSIEEQAAITVFLIAQMVRGKAWRTSMTQAYELLCEKLGGKERAHLARVEETNEDEEKFSILNGLPKTIKEFAPAVLDKVWMLQKTSARQHLWIGDEPIVRQNSMPTDGVFGNTGLACEGVEIYLPITPRLTLALFCPTLVPIFRASANHPTSLLYALEAERMMDAMKGERPYLLTPGNVTRLNALQVVHAERFIFHSLQDFSQVEGMITNRPDLRQTPRYVS